VFTSSCIRISRALNDFIDRVYELLKAQKYTRLKPALEFIQKNYKSKILLKGIAKTACKASQCFAVCVKNSSIPPYLII
jgi:hypothetical protein